MSAGARAVAGYALAGAALVAACTGLVAGVLSPEGATGVAVAAALAWGIQVASFSALVALRKRPAFFVAWGGGTVVRFGLVVCVGLWLARSGYPPLAVLLSLAGFLFLLLLLEPVFFRKGLRAE